MKITFERGLKCKYSGKDLYIISVNVTEDDGVYDFTIVFGVDMQNYTWTISETPIMCEFHVTQDVVNTLAIPL